MSMYTPLSSAVRSRILTNSKSITKVVLGCTLTGRFEQILS